MNMPFLCGPLNFNGIFYPGLARNECSPSALFLLPPVANTPAFILRLQGKKEILALGFGPGWFQKIVLWIVQEQLRCNSHGVTDGFA